MENLKQYDFDKIIIAIIDNRIAEEARDYLIAMGIEKNAIVYAPSYYLLGSEQFPTNKEKYLLDIDLYMDILDEYLGANTVYGGTNYYQSYIETGIQGLRKSGERIALYHIYEYLKPTYEVLDIGCNCGFLDLQIAPYVKKITGIEIEQRFVNIANRIKIMEGIENVEFYCDNYWDNKNLGQYDAVFAFAIHTNMIQLGATKEGFCRNIINHLRPDGYLF